jgi:hypothetical protein
MKKSLLTVALALLSAADTYAQGTIQFLNDGLSRLEYEAVWGEPIVYAPLGAHVGAFWGTDAAGASAIVGMGRGTIAGPTATSYVQGVWNWQNSGAATYPVSGTQEGQRVWLKIAAWYNGDAQSPTGAITHYGESEPVSVVLGPTAGPGTVVWQSATGTATDLAKPFVITNLVPEPSVVALGAVGLGALLLRRRKA